MHHGHCWIHPANGEHVGLTPLQLAHWISAIVSVFISSLKLAHAFFPTRLLVKLASVNLQIQGILMYKSMFEHVDTWGHRGGHTLVPNHLHHILATPEVNTTLLTAVVPLLTSLAQTVNHLERPSTPTTHHPSVPSSPPAPYEMELTQCLEPFANTQPQIKSNELAIHNLDAAGFSPDSIHCTSAVWIQELSGFLEGQAILLQKFCVGWSGQIMMVAKRRKLKHNS